MKSTETVRLKSKPKWQGRRDLNPQPLVLETSALPIELHPYTDSQRKLKQKGASEPNSLTPTFFKRVTKKKTRGTK